ncbi:MAG: phycobilisome protein [Prochlorotrichaceae cyanobacterium]|jgi:hypothetical protein
MLSQLDQLCRATEDRFAQDQELEFLEDYVQSFHQRKELYGKLRAMESDLVQKVYSYLNAKHPEVFQSGSQDLSKKWQQDTLRVIRYIAHAVLMNDIETYRQRFLLWFQTIMKAFGTQKSCQITYEVMTAVLQRSLSAEEYAMVQPFLQLTQETLSN